MNTRNPSSSVDLESAPAYSPYVVGGSLPRAPHDSLSVQVHPDALGALFGSGQQVLPPYDSRSNINVDTESLPTYAKEVLYDAELSRKLFYYGFLFFPLWIAGILVPFVTPSKPDPSQDNRSKEDWESELSRMRTEEIKWAWRCGFALNGFVLCIIIVVVLAVTLAGKH